VTTTFDFGLDELSSREGLSAWPEKRYKSLVSGVGNLPESVLS
jgi:hypothetical protein